MELLFTSINKDQVFCSQPCLRQMLRPVQESRNSQSVQVVVMTLMTVKYIYGFISFLGPTVSQLTTSAVVSTLSSLVASCNSTKKWSNLWDESDNTDHGVRTQLSEHNILKYEAGK